MLLYKNDALNKPTLKFKEMGQHINKYIKRNRNHKFSTGMIMLNFTRNQIDTN